MALLNGVWLVGPDGIPHQVPDNQAVIASFTGRGWTVTDLPSHLDPDDEEFQNALADLQDTRTLDDDGDPVAYQEEPPGTPPYSGNEPTEATPATEKKEVK